MLNLSVLLEDSARRYPDRIALVHGAERLTYAELDARADRIAALLVDRGIRPGDRIALTCPNIPAFPAVSRATTSTRCSRTSSSISRS